MISADITLPISDRLQFENDCRQADISVIPDLFAEEALNSSTADTLVIVNILLSSSNMILTLFNILKSYREQRTYKIEIVKNGIKISFDSKTPIQEIKNKLEELEAIGNDEQ